MKEKLEVAKSEDCTALQVEEEGKGTSDEVKSGQRGGGSAEAASDELPLPSQKLRTSLLYDTIRYVTTVECGWQALHTPLPVGKTVKL